MRDAMDEHGEYLVRLAFLYVKDWAAAEDIAQEVFIAYYKKSDQFSHQASLKTYLSKITINKCRDYLRSWKNRRIIFTDFLSNIVSPGQAPEISLVREEGRTSLADEILKLPLKYREVIILFYYQEFSIKEIGTLIECNENTVKTRLRRAKDLLRDQLDLREWEGFMHE
ncbi:RNA polymerase subunit sigma-70 [Planococcus lenghuensis]|uniref:RNA polymerase subunit sigma-70 n=2 Tax=Planococcus lenghuensis TaxID=2213202 RepID=A0A1Q2L3S3_9BACL|nr:RNA polymerase subunit sigma-70 [Planococcus lenghuensis]